MSRAYKCDRCGHLFEGQSNQLYPPVKQSQPWEVCDKIAGTIAYELCDACSDNFHHWMNTIVKAAPKESVK